MVDAERHVHPLPGPVPRGVGKRFLHRAVHGGFGVGAELSRARLLGRDIPLRFGFRRTGLPYSFDDRDAHEQVFSGGFGVSLNSDGGIGVAGGDVAIERGRRVGAGLTESFWRATFSMILSGI